MVDGENLSDLDDDKRKKAVESHYSWVDAAKFLGCKLSGLILEQWICPAQQKTKQKHR
jgi:hypothetical protein